NIDEYRPLAMMSTGSGASYIRRQGRDIGPRYCAPGFERTNAMFLGLSTFTWFHTILSLVALFSGLIVLGGILGSQRLPGWTGVYLVTAVATSATGFGF